MQNYRLRLSYFVIVDGDSKEQTFNNTIAAKSDDEALRAANLALDLVEYLTDWNGSNCEATLDRMNTERVAVLSDQLEIYQRQIRYGATYKSET